MRPIEPGDSPADWGTIPTLGGNPATSAPDPTTGTSATSTTQSTGADAQQNTSVNLLPPAPNWVNPIDVTGKMSAPWVFWLELLRRRVGGNSNVPASDMEVFELVDAQNPLSAQQKALDDLSKFIDGPVADSRSAGAQAALDALASLQALAPDTMPQPLAGPVSDLQALAFGQVDAPVQALQSQINDLYSLIWALPEPSVRSAGPKTLFTATATATVANTVTETTLVGSGVGSNVLPSNFFAVGKVLKVQMRGILSETGTPTLQIKIKYGSTVILDTTAITLTGGIPANAAWTLGADICCRSAGATGTIQCAGGFGYQTASGTSSVNYNWLPSNLATIDTTASNTLDVTVTWGTASASNTISSTIVIMDSAN